MIELDKKLECDLPEAIKQIREFWKHEEELNK